MNAEEIYKKYITPEPEPTSEPDLKIDRKTTELQKPTTPMGVATPTESKSGGFLSRVGPIVGQPGGITYSNYWDMIGPAGSGGRTYSPTTFKVNDVRVIMDNSMFGGRVLVEVLYSFGDFHCIEELSIDRCELELNSDSVMERIVHSTINKVFDTLMTHFGVEKQLKESLYQHMLKSSISHSFRHVD